MAAALVQQASEDEIGGICLVLVNLCLLRPFVKGSGSPDSDLFGTLVSLKGNIDRNLADRLTG